MQISVDNNDFLEFHGNVESDLEKAFEYIWSAFQNMFDTKERTRVRKLCEYVKYIWISSVLWLPVPDLNIGKR